MDKSFFRQEALNAATRVDDIQRTMRVSSSATRWTTVTLVAALVAGIAASGFVRVPIHVTGQGVLVGGDNSLAATVSAISAGYVSKIHVHQGAAVKAGDPLASLALPDRQAEVEKAQRLLDATRRDADSKQALRRQDEQAETESFNKQAASLDERIGDLTRQVAWLEERLRDVEKLHASGVATLDALANARIAAAKAADGLAATRADRVDLETRREEAKSTRERQTLADRLEISRLQGELDTARAALETEATVRADVSGRVGAVNTRRGALVSPGESLFDILPDAGDPSVRLTAILFVPVNEGKRVAKDNRALLTPADLPGNVHDRVVARVDAVSIIPVSSNRLQYVLGDDALARAVDEAGPTFEVSLTLETLAGGSGYRWTTPRPPSVDLTPGTPLAGRVTVEHTPLLALVVPALKRFFGVEQDQGMGRR
ncbi:MAG: NHLP bacteriocin system secretion protein [Firmicutes bacterium]|nr:NHLP bacteriocin system secretion protein [Bacillota bacterium]